MCAVWLLYASVALGAEAPEARDCVKKVRELFRRNSPEGYLEAAREAERCWVVEGQPQHLYHAAQARVNLRHGAHAAIDLVRYKRLLPAKRDDGVVRGLLEEISRDLVVSVGLTISPAPSGAGELVAVFLADSGGSAAVDETHKVMNGEARGEIIYSQEELAALGWRLSLDPGEWRLAWRDGSQWVTKADVLVAEGLSVTLELPQEEASAPAPEVEERPSGLFGARGAAERAASDEAPPTSRPGERRPAMIVGLGAGLSFGVGLGVLGYSARMDPGALSTGLSEAENAARGIAIADRGMYGWSGGGLVGAGIGGGVAAVTALARPRWGLLVGELGVGAAALVGGVAWSANVVKDYEIWTSDTKDIGLAPLLYDARTHYHSDVGSGLLLGFGAGLISGAAVALIWRAVSERRRR